MQEDKKYSFQAMTFQPRVQNVQWWRDAKILVHLFDDFVTLKTKKSQDEIRGLHKEYAKIIAGSEGLESYDEKVTEIILKNIAGNEEEGIKVISSMENFHAELEQTKQDFLFAESTISTVDGDIIKKSNMRILFETHLTGADSNSIPHKIDIQTKNLAETMELIEFAEQVREDFFLSTIQLRKSLKRGLNILNSMIYPETMPTMKKESTS